MKRLKILSIITLVIMLFAIPGVTLAHDDYCPETEDGRHDYSYHTSMRTTHPHKGYRECSCGERVYLEYRYNDECQKCQKELCRKGVHYYLYDIYYLDEYGYTGYGECYCGKTKYFSFDEYRLEREPNVGFITFFDELYSAKHPHYEYNIDRNKYYYDNTIHVGACGVCDLEDQYYDDVEEYEICTFIYEDDYFEEYEDYYWDEEYEDYEDKDAFWENNYSDDEELHEWLEIARKLLNP